MQNISTNMTEILRAKYEIDDRVQKAWFINPGMLFSMIFTKDKTMNANNEWYAGHKWRRASTGVQSQLLLSDKLIMFAVITLNDGSGNVLRRRMLSIAAEKFASTSSYRKLLSLDMPNDDSRIADALQMLSQRPETQSMPPVQFGINVPFTIASIYGAENDVYLLLDIQAVGRFDAMGTEDVNKEMLRRIIASSATICPTCKGVYPAFENMLPSTGAQIFAGGRRLLQTSSAQFFDGSMTILLVYDKNVGDAIMLSYPDVLMSIYSAQNYSSSLLATTKNMTALQRLAADLSNNYVLVNNITAHAGDKQINIVVRMEDSLVLTPPAKTPHHPNKEIDVSVFGEMQSNWYWRTDRYVYCNPDVVTPGTPPDLSKCQDISLSTSSANSSGRSFDPLIATIFLAASFILFWT